MSDVGAERLAKILTQECHEAVSRRGEYEPCDKPAVALRYDDTFGTWYPVCPRHTRGDCRPLHKDVLLRVVSDVMALDGGYSENNRHAYCISPLALRSAVEEALK